MAYNRQNLAGESLQDLREYVLNELDQIQKAFAVLDFLRLKIWYEEPPRLYDGLVVFADGTSWNPGSGEGFYGYYNGSWTKL